MAMSCETAARDNRNTTNSGRTMRMVSPGGDLYWGVLANATGYRPPDRKESGPLRGALRGNRLGEQRDHLAIECRDVAGLAARHPIAVAHHFFIDPMRAGLSHIVLNSVIAGEGAIFCQACRDQQPRRVANERDRLARAVELLHELLRFGNNAQKISVHGATGQQHGVELVRTRVSQSHIHLELVALLYV